MRFAAAYGTIGIAVVLAFGMSVPGEWYGLSVKAGPVNSSTVQYVDRTNKTNRLMVPVTVIGKTRSAPVDVGDVGQAPVTPIKILDGCEPVFSPLSTSAQANLPGRCAS